MKLTIYQADAFTNRLFGGNPAAIVPLTEWLPDEMMQHIAAENNLAETAFFVPEGDGYQLRWFTPALEIDLCGHATLAAAHILFTELGFKGNTINFNTVKAGVLTVSNANGLYTLNFPSRVAVPVAAPAGLIDAIGGGPQPIAVLKSRDYMLVYNSEAEVAALTPDFAALSKIDGMVIVTAKGDEVDFVSRFFAPTAGINEDPVTGSAHCNLIPYWAEKLGKNELHAYQISERKGELWCKLDGDRALMAGNAVTYLKGEIYI